LKISIFNWRKYVCDLKKTNFIEYFVLNHLVRGDRESKGNHLKFSKEVRRRQKSCVEGVV